MSEIQPMPRFFWFGVLWHHAGEKKKKTKQPQKLKLTTVLQIFTKKQSVKQLLKHCSHPHYWSECV